jgi:RNA polymerase sigma-70 factor (sigma-E family)
MVSIPLENSHQHRALPRGTLARLLLWVELSLEMAEEAVTQPARLEELYVRHMPAAIGLAFLLTGDRDAAEDLVQDAFVRLTGKFHHLRNPEAFGSYLRRTLVNLHLSRLRRIRLERHIAAQQRGIEPQSSMPDVAGSADLWAGLQRLPPRQRAAVILRYYEDLSERESAELLRCSVAAVRSLVARAMETLREKVPGEEP